MHQQHLHGESQHLMTLSKLVEYHNHRRGDDSVEYNKTQESDHQSSPKVF